jgi:hypothetical protein
MHFTLDISDDLAERIHREADRKGIDPTAVVEFALEQHLGDGVSTDFGGLSEAELLRIIGEGFSPDEWMRYDQLVQDRKSETLAPEDHQLLIHLTDRQEAIGTRRLAALVQLSRRRGVTVDELMSQLEIEPRSVA